MSPETAGRPLLDGFRPRGAEATPPAEPVAVEAIGITKAYGATLALDDVSFAARSGCVSVILGENGAGKSTLMKVLAGEESPDAGRILRDGREVILRSPRSARQHGIALIHQELSLFPDLTVTENIFAGRERHRLGIVNERDERTAVVALLALLDPRIDPQAMVSTLAVGQQQVVEIARALAEDARVLIMDEPTSALSSAEVDALFGIIRQLVAGGVAVIYISHRMDEIFRIGDNLTVLRDGHLVATAAAREVDMEWALDNMLGTKQRAVLRAVQAERAVPSATPAQLRPALAAEGLFLADEHAGRLVLDDVSLSLWPGEVLGVYGLLGAGKTELAETIAGLRRDAAGVVRVGGRIVKNTVPARMRVGIALVPEDRQRDALVRTTSVADNILLSSFARMARAWVIFGVRAERAVRSMIAALSIRVTQSALPITSLSGGNQQKTIIARALLTRPKVLILDEPTRGIDVGAKAEVYEIVRRLAHDGLAVLLCSSELAEVMAITDRIMVLSRGHVRGVFDSRSTAEAEVARASAAVA